MKDLTKVLLSVTAVLGAVMQVPAVQGAVSGFIGSHPTLASLGTLLTLVGSLLYQPKQQ